MSDRHLPSKELADAIGVLETSFNHGRDEILVAALVLKRHIQTNAPETGAHAPLVREIFERHNRVSKLLWGGPVAVMLGPMDADDAHVDRGRLLSLLTPEQRGELKAGGQP